MVYTHTYKHTNTHTHKPVCEHEDFTVIWNLNARVCVELEMNRFTGNNWSHCNSNKRFKEKLGNHARETFNRFTTKVSCNLKITDNTESTAV
jgi:hypothetical protein